MEKTFIIDTSDAGQRLDKFVAAKFPQYTRVFAKQQIKLGNILVNDQVAKPSCILRQSDCVALAPSFVVPSKTEILPNPEIKLNIIYEDNDVIAIDKPAGLAVHPRQDKRGRPLLTETSNTLVSGLLARYPLLKNIGDAPQIRPGIVHRLDKDTSGVIIIVKNQKSFDWLKKQFKERKVEKKYLALVEGTVKNDAGEIALALARAKSDPTRQKIAAEGKTALTRYRVLQRFKNQTLLEVKPQTGRLHQIRVHLKWLGYPITGDQKYGAKKQMPLKDLSRQFLHAAELQITLPNGQKKVFQSPLSLDLKQVLQKLEKIGQ